MLTAPTKLYTPDKHSFFDDLATLIFVYFSHVYAIQAHHALNDFERDLGQHHLENLVKPIRDRKFGIGFGLQKSNDMLFLPVFQVINPIVSGGWPSEIGVHRLPNSRGKRVNLLTDSERRTKIEARITASSFLNYYESQQDNIAKKYGIDTPSWPPVLNFARVLRNACGHNGMIFFTNLKALPVSWNGWTYAPGDNGTEVFLGKASLGIGEIILLFEDMHNEIYP